VVKEFGGQARFVAENYGASDLARRFGVTRYPAIFVDDVLVAKPKDFGFYGKGEGQGDGRYTPFKSVASHERFRADLTRMIQLLIEGRKDAARAAAATSDGPELASIPAFTLTDLAGKPIGRDDLKGRVVAVEFWATWCPPCRGTLGWLRELKTRYGDRLAVLAVAIESEPGDVGKVAQALAPAVRFAMGSPEMARAFGDVTAVPTLFLFDGEGRTVATYYGAPPDLHADAEGRIRSLLP
jgi:thiol-disulfide isomerase/thioredoxin